MKRSVVSSPLPSPDTDSVMSTNLPENDSDSSRRVAGHPESAREARPSLPRRARRVLLGLETSGPGGAEQMILQLAEALRALGTEVEIATMQPGWMTERAAELDLPVWIEAQRPGVDWNWVVRMRRRMRSAGIDVFHGHEFEMNAYGGLAARLAGIPSVATLHGVVAGTDRRHVFAYRLMRLLGQRPIAVSAELWSALAPRIWARDLKPNVILNGTPVPPRKTPDARQAERLAARRELIQEGLAIDSDRPLLIAIGNLYPVKDHASLLRAIAHQPDVQVAIAGRGDEEANLLNLAHELGVADRFHLLGLRRDVQRLLAAADLFVHPSRNEGLPLAILEAMAAQTPIVASCVGGIPEALVHREMAELVPPESPNELGQAIEALLARPEQRERYVEAAWREARERFSVESMARGYQEVYEQVLA